MSSEHAPFALNQVNVSQPRLSTSGSKQSLAASEDYYSLNTGSISGDETSQRTAFKYTTPPSRLETPTARNQPAQTRVTDGQSEQQILPQALVESPTVPQAVRFATQPAQIKRKPVGSGSSTDSWRGAMDPQITPVTTPGLDDTPYIRFAIDQLTRDEEVRGTRTYAAPVSAVRGPTALQQSQLAQRPERIVPLQQFAGGARDFPVETGVHDEGLGYVSLQRPPPTIMASQPPPAMKPPRVRSDSATGASAPLMAGMTRGPNTAASNNRYPQLMRGSDLPDVFVPFNAPHDSPAFPPLRFLPGILRLPWLGLFIFVMVLMLTGLMFCAIYSDDKGLWDYKNFGDNRYFTFNYLPVLFGIAILLWLQEIQSATTRIAPYIGLASENSRARTDAPFLNLYPTQFLLPQTSYFRAGQPIIGSCFLMFWLFNFTIPLLASSFNVQFYGSVTTGTWRWVAVQGVIWTVITLYILTLIALLLLLLHLRRSATGLKWDPRSLADILTLLDRSNFLAEYAGAETFAHADDFRQRLWSRADRLGYWHTSRRSQDIFYGLGEDGAATRAYTVEAGRIKEKTRSIPSVDTTDSRHDDGRPMRSRQGKGAAYSIRADIRSVTTRRRYLPWFLRDSAVVAFAIIASVLYIAFLVVSFVNNALKDGFTPDLRSSSTGGGFSSANFFYSFLPALLAMVLFLLWQPFDLAYRRLEAWAQLSRPDGATAEQSLLLDYTCSAPFSLTLKALVNRHWLVAYLSFISIINATLPVLAGGMFWAQFYTGDQEVRIVASPPALYALCFFLALYTVSYFALFPGRRERALPHDCKRLCEVISWCYMSRLLNERAFMRCPSKAELVTRLIGRASPVWESGFLASVTNLVSKNGSKARLDEKANPTPTGGYTGAGVRQINLPHETRYGFGVYVGRDGQEHLGMDRVRRAGESDMVLFDDTRRSRKGRGSLA